MWLGCSGLVKTHRSQQYTQERNEIKKMFKVCQLKSDRWGYIPSASTHTAYPETYKSLPDSLPTLFINESASVFSTKMLTPENPAHVGVGVTLLGALPTDLIRDKSFLLHSSLLALTSLALGSHGIERVGDAIRFSELSGAV